MPATPFSPSNPRKSTSGAFAKGFWRFAKGLREARNRAIHLLKLTLLTITCAPFMVVAALFFLCAAPVVIVSALFSGRENGHARL